LHLAAALVVAKAETVNPVLPSTSELIWGAASFLVLFAFLYKKVFPRIQEAMDERANRIRGALEEAEENRQEAQRLLETYRERLTGAREEARRILEEARESAEAQRRDILARADREAQGILDRAEKEITAQRNHAIAELRQDVGRIAVTVAGRIVGESLDGERHLRLVDDYIRELTASAGNGHGERGS
jgi:F-type H+-transporting ATPase subunit b